MWFPFLRGIVSVNGEKQSMRTQVVIGVRTAAVPAYLDFRARRRFSCSPGCADVGTSLQRESCDEKAAKLFEIGVSLSFHLLL